MSELNYSIGDPTIDSQIVQMNVSDAVVVPLMTIPKMVSQALRKMTALNWKPQVFLGIGNSSTRAPLRGAPFGPHLRTFVRPEPSFRNILAAAIPIAMSSDKIGG